MTFTVRPAGCKHIFVIPKRRDDSVFPNSKVMINKETKPGQRILKAVSKLFDYQGYNATGVNQIVQESGYQH
ncbi:hypothetical protein Dfri01_30920 [Dyadobacter frigoris]|nr:hypothetical protein Dfri01_30920 [Dyadobacter frigoris]